MGIIDELRGRPSVLPPIAANLSVSSITDPSITEPPPAPSETEPIAGLVCIIEYEGDQRLIVCQRFTTIGEDGYIGAVCHSANGYRQFRTDRIDTVFDAASGEVLGDGTFFRQFRVDGARERAATWGLSRSRKYTLVGGLNVLAFMSRCDGHWHRLEADVIERFVCSMWLRKEWEGDPPLNEIVAHAERLAPDWTIVCRALEQYAHSATSSQILHRAVADLIAADGVICDDESRWAYALADHLDTMAENSVREHQGIPITIEVNRGRRELDI